MCEVEVVSQGKRNSDLASATIFRNDVLGLQWVEYGLRDDRVFEGRIVASTEGQVAIAEFVSPTFNERRFNVNETVRSLMAGLNHAHTMSIKYEDVPGWSETVLALADSRVVGNRLKGSLLDFVGIVIPESVALDFLKHLSVEIE